jgi:uncharacterized protein YndB with AHSA1/START domain
MRAFRYTEHIERPREEVFTYMMDFSTAPRWRNMVRRVEVVGVGPVQAGSKLLFTMDVTGENRRGEVLLWCYQPPYCFGQTNTRGGVTGVFEYILEQNGTGTTSTFTGDLKPHGLMWLALPWLLKSNRIRFRDQLAALKRAIEQKN